MTEKQEAASDKASSIRPRYMDRLRGLKVNSGVKGASRDRRRRGLLNTPAANASIQEARQRMAQARMRSAFSPEDRKLLTDLTEALRANTATLREVYDLGPQEGEEAPETVEATEAASPSEATDSEAEASDEPQDEGSAEADDK